MDTEKLINYFNKQIENLPALRNETALNKSMNFKKWWEGIKATLQRMGGDYIKRAQHIHFSPMVVSMGYRDHEADTRAYLSGLNDAESMISSVIEELEMWGYDTATVSSSSFKQSGSSPTSLILNVTMSQQQVQEINQKIDIGQYAPDVQEQLTSLLDELKKKDKDEDKLKRTIKWLADKGVDALIAVLLASANLTN